jgi:hypothetical protein
MAVFVVSAIIHMAPLWHKNDYPKMPREDDVLEALRPLAIPPGDYMLPRPSGTAEMRSPEFAQKMEKGPVMVVTVLPNGPMTMTSSLVQWFVYSAVVGLFSAYIAGRALAPGAGAVSAFRFVGATAFMGYTVALWQMSIWYRRAWGSTVKATVDGLIYAVVTAAVFGWLWPR